MSDYRLHLAAWAGQTQAVSYLCKHRADVGAAAMDDMGAIHFAAQKGHLEVVRALVSSGASVKSFTRKGMTPLHYAAQGSHLDLAKYLVRKGGNLGARSKSGKTPLDLACSEEICTVLLEYEKLCSKGHQNVKDKDEELKEPKPSVSEEAENADGYSEEAKETDVKRKAADEDGTEEEASKKPKKARVALNHLLSADDNQEDEENM